jgi:uncharacterized Zn-binding protein involved in type VI secretion
VKFATTTRGISVLLLATSLAAVAASHGDKKEKEQSAAQTVDSGSFTVFVNGRPVATETSNIQQQNTNSIIKSQLKGDSPSDPLQKSELEITSTGDLLHYDWSQSSGGSLSVQPNNEFLIEKISTPTSPKPAEQPFLMPSTSVILDNNFFIHREVLAWRFLAAGCKQDPAGWKCQQAGDFGVLVPQDRTSMHVRMEMVGKEKVKIRGAERELLRLNLKGDTFDWALWLDDHDQFKLMRVTIPADNIEVVRD